MFSMVRRSTAMVAVVALVAGLWCVSDAVAEGTAVIKGKVSYKGDPPKRMKIDVNADPNCAKIHAGGKGIGTENVVVNKDSQTLQNVIVSVKDGLGDETFEVPSEPAVIDQEGCHYSPHIVVMQKGQKLMVRNSDDTLHNIHGLPKKNPEFNFGQPKKGMEKELEFNQEEFFPVKCDVHPWMGAHIAVFDHPFFDVTDKDGEGMFELSGLPAGEYTIEAWHEEYGTQEQKVTVADGETKEIEFVYEIK